MGANKPYAEHQSEPLPGSRSRTLSHIPRQWVVLQPHGRHAKAAGEGGVHIDVEDVKWEEKAAEAGGVREGLSAEEAQPCQRLMPQARRRLVGVKNKVGGGHVPAIVRVCKVANRPARTRVDGPEGGGEA